MSDHDPFWWFWWLRRNVGSYTAIITPLLFVVLLVQVGFSIAYGSSLWVVAVLLVALSGVVLLGGVYVYVCLRDQQKVDEELRWLESMRDSRDSGSTERDQWQRVIDDYRSKM